VAATALPFAAWRRAGAARAASLAISARDAITPWATPHSSNDGRSARLVLPIVVSEAQAVTGGPPRRSHGARRRAWRPACSVELVGKPDDRPVQARGIVGRDVALAGAVECQWLL